MSSLELSSGGSIPVVGLGTWRSEPGVVKAAVLKAIDVGYRHFDCAWVYGNEKEIGEAFAQAFAAGTVSRGDLFVTGKLWNTHHACVEEACRKTLQDLQLESLDLYLIHWPVAWEEQSVNHDEGEAVPMDYTTFRPKFAKVPMLETWRQMEALVDAGLVKSIGISNFRIPMIVDLIAGARIPPSVHQFETHPLFPRTSLVEEMKKWAIIPQAYSPLGSAEAVKKILGNETIVEIAAAHGKTAAQVVLRWNVQRGCVVLPKTTNEARLAENFAVTDFTLTEGEMEKISALGDPPQSSIRSFVLMAWNWDPFL